MKQEKKHFNNMEQIPIVTLASLDPEARARITRMYLQAKLDGTIKSDTCSVFNRTFIKPNPVPADWK